jgi:hypothetical protein
VSKASCDWEIVDAFDSLTDYRRFLTWINDQVTAGLVRLVQVERPYSGSTLWDEHWYECGVNGETWRLVAPEPPFRGIFKPVK